MIPRLDGAAKTAVMEIQYDEYGSGDPAWMHSELFRTTMIAAGLDGSYGAYVDRPRDDLATVNLITLFGVHRRWRGALVGHLAAFEMTSSLPNRAYAHGFRRLGFDDDAVRFFDEHVEADSVHEVLAGDLAAGLAVEEPELASDVVFGAMAMALLEGRFADGLLRAAGRRLDAPPGWRAVVVSQDLSYILPTEPSRGRERRGARSLRPMAVPRVQLIVVDGSDPDRVRAHRERWGSIATLAVPDADVRCLNGKVRGVLTGLRRARHEHVIIADDDVRYDDEALLRMQELLRNADLVRPQNFFDPILARPLGHVADAAQPGARERPPWDPGRAALLPHVHRWLRRRRALREPRAGQDGARGGRKGSSTRPRCTCADCRPPPLDSWNSASPGVRRPGATRPAGVLPGARAGA